MKKIVLLLIVIVISGCNTEIIEKELNQYYLSSTSTNKSNTSGINYIFDFETNETIKSNNIESDNGILVYDNENDSILYPLYSSYTDSINIYFYNPEDQTSKFLNTQFNIVKDIIPRENDFIILANPIGKKETCLYKIDKKTYKIQEINLLNNKNNDISTWNISYIPQTDEIIIQAYSISEESKLVEKWNNNQTNNKYFSIPYYFYIYNEGNKAEYLFEYEMPEPDKMISNGKDILFEINYKDEVYRYNIETKDISIENTLETLEGVFYMSNNGKYLYQISSEYKIEKVDYRNNKIIELSYELNKQCGRNGIMLKK